jgi:hypothetical protein
MINPTELRIGNLIRYTGAQYPFYPLKDGVVQVEEVLSAGVNRSQGDSTLYEADKLEGIPLNPEWLERMEFNRFADGSYHRPAMFTWRVLYDAYEKAASYCTGTYPELGHRVHLNVRIESVHQLQNLYFALTGEELTIKVTV